MGGDEAGASRSFTPRCKGHPFLLGSGVRLHPPRLRLLGRGGGLVVYLVNGEQVRNEIDGDFVNGGYPIYVPPDEIWIDDAQGHGCVQRLPVWPTGT